MPNLIQLLNLNDLSQKNGQALIWNLLNSTIAWKMPKNKVFSGPYLSVLGLHLKSKSRYSVRIWGVKDQDKLGIPISFDAVLF